MSLIRNYVFPVVETEPDGDAAAFRSLLGTGWMIGRRGFALTAAHVLAGATAPRAIFVAPDGEWVAHEIQEVELNESIDVAAMLLPAGPSWDSCFAVSADGAHQSCECHTWGYPDDVLWEKVTNGRAIARPDLAFVPGHVRRRLSGTPLPQIGALDLLELTSPAGAGCSGSPVVSARDTAPGQLWPVVGLYLGERVSDGVSVGYAVRSEAFGAWAPRMIGRSVAFEAALGAVLT